MRRGRRGGYAQLDNHLTLFSRQGLRTLVFGVRRLSAARADQWLQTYVAARDARVRRLVRSARPSVACLSVRRFIRSAVCPFVCPSGLKL